MVAGWVHKSCFPVTHLAPGSGRVSNKSRFLVTPFLGQPDGDRMSVKSCFPVTQLSITWTLWWRQGECTCPIFLRHLSWANLTAETSNCIPKTVNWWSVDDTVFEIVPQSTVVRRKIVGRESLFSILVSCECDSPERICTNRSVTVVRRVLTLTVLFSSWLTCRNLCLECCVCGQDSVSVFPLDSPFSVLWQWQGECLQSCFSYDSPLGICVGGVVIIRVPEEEAVALTGAAMLPGLGARVIVDEGRMEMLGVPGIWTRTPGRREVPVRLAAPTTDPDNKETPAVSTGQKL